MKLRRLNWEFWEHPATANGNGITDYRKWEGEDGSYIVFSRQPSREDEWSHRFPYAGLTIDATIEVAQDIKDIIEYHRAKIGPKPLSDADKLKQATDLLSKITRYITDAEDPKDGFERIQEAIGKFFQEVIYAKK